MKVSNLLKSCVLLGVLALVGTTFTSCAKSKGCTDPKAETYDATAEESDPTLCVYAREKFIGKYKGTLICPGPLKAGINNPSYDFAISEAAGLTVEDVTLDLTVFGAPTKLAAKIAKDVITIDQVIRNVPFPVGTSTVTSNIIAKGTAKLAADNKTLTGDIDITIQVAANNSTLAADKCPITGTKQ
jgi:hypothetical protein